MFIRFKILEGVNDVNDYFYSRILCYAGCSNVTNDTNVSNATNVSNDTNDINVPTLPTLPVLIRGKILADRLSKETRTLPSRVSTREGRHDQDRSPLHIYLIS